MTPWTEAHEIPLSVGFPRLGYWNHGNFLLQGSSWAKYQTQVPCIAGRFFTYWATGEAHLPGMAPDSYDCSSSLEGTRQWKSLGTPGLSRTCWTQLCFAFWDWALLKKFAWQAVINILMELRELGKRTSTQAGLGGMIRQMLGPPLSLIFFSVWRQRLKPREGNRLWSALFSPRPGGLEPRWGG